MAISIIGTSTKSGGCTSVTIDKPSGTSDGDLMLMCYTNEDRTGGSAPGVLPGGWTEYLSYWEVFGGWVKVAYKVASSEGTSYNITGLDKNICVGILTIRGQATGTSWQDKSSTSGRGAGAVCPSITPSANNSLIILSGGAPRATTTRSNYTNATNPLTWTEQWDFMGNRDVSWCGGADGVSGAIATATQSTAGATGQFSFTSTLSSTEVNIAFNVLADAGSTPPIIRNILFRRKPGGGIFYFKQ